MMRKFLRYSLACLFTGAGLMHFKAPDTYTKVMPDYLPFPLALVGISGVAEIAGGLGVLPQSTRRWAGYGLIALLLAVFPANIHMAVHGTENVGIDVPRWIWWARLPFQAVFIAWVWFAAIDKKAQ
ncbi:DoxX family membrane protein [bacterium]|nr:MAG: DoxX family membrane protein [bacterium]